MDNSQIVRILKLQASLMELHQENEFKVRNLNTALVTLDRTDQNLAELTQAELESLVGKSVAAKVIEIRENGTTAELTELIGQTPQGVIGLLEVKGLGPKKIRALWQEHGIDSPEKLLDAAQNNRLASLKGFGEKTQASILEALLFAKSAEGKLHYAEAEKLALHLLEEFRLRLPEATWSLTGALHRQDPVIEQLDFLLVAESPLNLRDSANSWSDVTWQWADSGLWRWQGTHAPSGMSLHIHLAKPEEAGSRQIVLSSAPAHLEHEPGEMTLLSYLIKHPVATEEQAYESFGVPYILPEMREGHIEWDWVQQHQTSELVQPSDLKGILHNHSTYSDGSHTLTEMAEECRRLGYEYLGISDHSQSAFYANGLKEEAVLAQHAEIEQLNARMAPFKILKGIESDILPDGSLDYPEEILARFDFIVASIHSGLSMDEAKATQRLVRAIENPYTTILGHPTGRLLLRREGYPIHHTTVIDACAANGVAIEINAHPWRLDLDWRYVDYAQNKGVKISINPDAHEKAGYADMNYGVYVARKGGLLTSNTLNALSLAEFETWLAELKSRRGITA